MKFTVVVDRSPPVYQPGDGLKGHVRLELTEDLKIRDIRLKFSGKASVGWQERQNAGNGSSYKATFASEETYFSDEISVYGKDDTAVLSPGEHEYPFHFVLPPEIPSSYQTSTGKVTYQLKAHLDRPWAFDSYAETFITVMRPLDLNKIANTTGMAEGSKSASLCCLCCKSGPIEATLRVERRGYVPGEILHFQADIENNSSRRINCTKARFLMKCSYVTKVKTKVCDNVLARLTQPEIPPGESYHWENGCFTIPDIPPSYLEKCGIIHIQYLLQLMVDISGPGVDLLVPVEIIVGSVPLDRTVLSAIRDARTEEQFKNSPTKSINGTDHKTTGSPLARSTPTNNEDSRTTITYSPVIPIGNS